MNVRARENCLSSPIFSSKTRKVFYTVIDEIADFNVEKKIRAAVKKTEMKPPVQPGAILQIDYLPQKGKDE